MTDNGAHHVPDPEDDGSCADMATQAAAGGEPAVPRGYHLIVPVCHGRWSVSRRRASVLSVRLKGSSDLSVAYQRKLICATERRTSSQTQVSIALPVPYFGRHILVLVFFAECTSALILIYIKSHSIS